MIKIFSPFARTGTKDRLNKRLARQQARHEREAKRISGQIEFLSAQLAEHRAARAAVYAARSELALDITTIDGEIAAGLLAEDAREAEPSIEVFPADGVTSWRPILDAAEARASA